MLFSSLQWKMPRIYFINCCRAASEMIFILNKFIFVGLICRAKIKRQQLGLWIFCTVPLISNKEAEKAYPARFVHLLPLTPHEYMHAHTLVCLCVCLCVCMCVHAHPYTFPIHWAYTNRWWVVRWFLVLLFRLLSLKNQTSHSENHWKKDFNHENHDLM